MRSRLFTASLFLCALLPFAQSACGSEDETRFGGPSGLANRKVPPVPGEATATATTPGAPAPCDSSGQSTQEGGTCTVSWATDIFPKIQPGGVWKCADANCHGPAGAAGTGPNSPTIDGTDSQKAYAALVAFSVDSTNPYINACSSDPSASEMPANLRGDIQQQMPTQGAGVSPANATPGDIATLETWLACGAPFN